MYYGLVAPGFKTITTDYQMVERAKVFYPYLKWRKFTTSEAAVDFISRNYTEQRVKMIRNYGDTFSDLYLSAKYTIANNCVYYELDTHRVGNFRVISPSAMIEYRAGRIYIKMENTYLDAVSISGNMSAIYHLLDIVGECIDVNLVLPNFSIYYALTQYKRDNVRPIKLVQDKIANRLCKVAFTLKMEDTQYE